MIQKSKQPEPYSINYRVLKETIIVLTIKNIKL